MEFLAYSDVHHDCYTNGIILEDTISVENQITQYAVTHNINDVFFLGDWYRATNPVQKAIKAAEASWKDRSDHNITTRVLVGNHDRETKSIYSGHAFQAANTFTKDLENVYVHSVVEEFEIDGIIFLCVPSGHENVERLVNYNRSRNKPVIVLFHGLVAGSALANGATASGGIHPKILRDLQANYILGGDNHTQQRLDSVLGCPSMYLGAPLQHNWGDRGQKRGFWHITANFNDGEFVFYENFIQSYHPRFIRTKLNIKNETDAIMQIHNILCSENIDNNNAGVVEITFIGEHAGSLNVDAIKHNLSGMNLRQVKLSIDRTYEKLEVSRGISGMNKPEDKWSHHIANGAKIDELNPVMLAEMGKWALQEARKQT